VKWVDFESHVNSVDSTHFLAPSVLASVLLPEKNENKSFDSVAQAFHMASMRAKDIPMLIWTLVASG